MNDAWVMALETDNRIAAIMKNLFQISKLVNRFPTMSDVFILSCYDLTMSDGL